MVSTDALLESPRVLGDRVKRIEDPNLITGHGTFIDDVRLPGTLHMQMVRSPYAHARILTINSDDARQMPGVITVVTGADVKDGPRIGPAPAAGVNMGPRYLLAIDKVRYVGEAVAVVVAETLYQARDAALAIAVEYEVLRPITTVAEAIADGAPQVHDEAPGNIATVHTITSGDYAQAAAEADRVVRGHILQPRLVPMFMEPRVTLAAWDDGLRRLTVWDSSQGPHRMKEDFARLFRLDQDAVHVIAPDIGGSFGAKADHYPDKDLIPWLAMRLKRPVKYQEDRRENFVETGHGRGQTTDIEAAVKDDGTVLGVRVRILADQGAHPAGGLGQSGTTIGLGSGPYRFRNVDYQATVLYTNKTPTVAYRGTGRPEATYMLERMMDFIAYDLGLDPAEVRRKNFVRADEFPYRAPTGRVYDNGDYEGALDRALQAVDYEGLRRWQAEQQAQGKLVGIGISSYIESTGGGPTPTNARRAALGVASIRVESNGRVNLYTGSSPHGQGMLTSLAQIVAGIIGVPFQSIKAFKGDTDVVQIGYGSGGSGTLISSGSAMLMAAAKLRAKIVRIAGVMLEANPDDLILEQNRYVVKGTDRGVTFQEIVRRAHAPWGLPKDIEPGLEESYYYEAQGAATPFGTHISVVAIDRDTGKVKLTRFVAVDDCGRRISPLLVDGQLHGGFAQGIAAALQEGVVYDENGQLLTATLMDYAAVRADDLPSFELVEQVTLSPNNPLGAKGVGEAGTIGATPAPVNAVMDALKPLGVRNLDMPLTAEKVWRAIHGQ